MPSEHTVAVVREADALDSAYQMGYDGFDEAPPEVDEPADALIHFKESAEWANNVHPKLRATAGYVDSGTGTYTVPRKVIVVPDGNEHDSPMNGVQMGIGHVEDALVGAFDKGALDAMSGDSWNPESCEDIHTGTV